MAPKSLRLTFGGHFITQASLRLISYAGYCCIRALMRAKKRTGKRAA